MDWTWWEPPNPEVDTVDSKYILLGPVSPSINRSVFKFPDSEAYARLLQLEEDKQFQGSYTNFGSFNL